ncbi:MAG TPA: VOC family protein [Dehalococcoidia bacterium]|nr:VOC family protein [Dehalococcoidia bacterium]
MTTRVDYDARRAELRRKYLTPNPPPTTARGVHHLAMICSNIEQTIEFYTQVLGFPLTQLFQNRDLPSSTHFFFDIGNGNFLAFFDFPELGLGPTQEALGAMHHVAISVYEDQFDAIRQRVQDRGIDIFQHGTSIYFRDPDGALIEISSRPLREMGAGEHRKH